MRAWLVLGLLLLATPAAAQAPEVLPVTEVGEPEAPPGPPIVFDADGRGTVRQPQATGEPLRAVQYAPQQGELQPVYGYPWWWRPYWDYDPAAMYLFGDPYYGRHVLETLNRTTWPGWCP